VGSLALGFVNSAVYNLVPKVIAYYRTELPEVDLEMREMTSGDLVEAMLGGRIDVALLRASSVMKESGLEFFTISREPMLLVLPHAHPLAKLRRVPVRKLDGLDFVQFSAASSPYFREISDSIFQQARVRPNVVYESLLPTMLSLVESGMGAALVPAGMSRLLTDRLIYKPLSGAAEEAVATLQCARRRDDRSPLVSGFLETVRLLVRLGAVR
jgi:DNA-binding transcriptional LysR family regulator